MAFAIEVLPVGVFQGDKRDRSRTTALFITLHDRLALLVSPCKGFSLVRNKTVLLWLSVNFSR